MNIPVISIVVVIIVVALLWWVGTQFITDEFLLKVGRVVVVTLAVIYLLALLTGNAPTITFR